VQMAVRYFLSQPTAVRLRKQAIAVTGVLAITYVEK
jgi:hypothetical protein